MSLLCHFKEIIVLTESHQKVINLTLLAFVPIYPKESDNSWTKVLSHCVWVFGVCFPSGGVACKAFVCFFFNTPLYLCGLRLVCLSEGELKCLPIVQMQFVFCFLEVVLMFQPSVAVFYCFCFDVHAFLCVPSHSALSYSILSVVYLQ